MSKPHSASGEEAGEVHAAVIIVYGATGDLARRMVLPALFDMAARGMLPARYRVIGSGRGHVSDDTFRAHVHDALAEADRHPPEPAWRDFAVRLSFAGGGFTADDPGQLLAAIERAERGIRAEGAIAIHGPARAETIPLVHYYAVPPATFGELIGALSEHRLADRSRVVFEKPFGTDVKSFERLQQQVSAVLDESHVYRLDHFLAKEAVRGLPAMRLANAPLARSWDRESIAAVQIDVPETLDVAHKGGVYDATGAFLDMLVTHLFQVAAVVALEPPRSLAPADIADAREAVFEHFRPLSADDVVFGQYHGYTAHPGVPSHSATETFAAARLWIDNERWRGVPFLLRSGKAMGLRAQQISLLYKGMATEQRHSLERRGAVLTFSMTGSGELHMSLLAQEQGLHDDLTVAETQVGLGGADGLAPYVRLMHDTLAGEQGLFTRPDGLARLWDVAAPVLDNPPVPEPYDRGTMGPARADHLAEPHGWLLQATLPAMLGTPPRHNTPRRPRRRSNGRGGNGRLRAVQ
jgi:glucose-6-phosphate 1-dehydrogenase